jgi:hypothetical protein
VLGCVLASLLHRGRSVASDRAVLAARALEREADSGDDVPGVVLARSLDRGAAGGDSGGAHGSDEMERQHDQADGDDREADCVE